MPKTKLEQRFDKAVWLIRNGPPADSSTSEKLKFYSLFKQATEGDCTAAQPWAVQVTLAGRRVRGTSVQEIELAP